MRTLAAGLVKFADGTRELEERVGKGDLVGIVGFTGPEAVAQHEFTSRHSPPSWEGKTKLIYSHQGTGPNYLQGPLFRDYPAWMQRIARDLYEPHGAREAMVSAMDDLKDAAQRQVPRDKGDLAGTATAAVVDDGREVSRKRG
jgi:hypothetical protein